MSTVLQKVREKYPAYADVSDDQLALSLAKKFPQYLDHEDFRTQVEQFQGLNLGQQQQLDTWRYAPPVQASRIEQTDQFEPLNFNTPSVSQSTLALPPRQQWELPSSEATMQDMVKFLSPEQQAAETQVQKQKQKSGMRQDLLKDIQSWTPEKAVTRLGLSIGQAGGQLQRMGAGVLGAMPEGGFESIPALTLKMANMLQKGVTGKSRQEIARQLAKGGKDTIEAYEQLGRDVGSGPALDIPSQLASTFMASSPVIPAAILGGLPAAITVAGMQSLGATYTDAVDAYVAEGESQESAEQKALLPAYLAGAITAGTVRAFGSTGVEALAKGFSRQAMDQIVMTVLKHAGLEGAQEISDQIGQSIVSKLTYRPEMTVGDAVEEVIFGGAAGALLGGASSAGGITAQRLGRSPEAVQVARMLEENVSNSELNAALDALVDIEALQSSEVEGGGRLTQREIEQRIFDRQADLRDAREQQQLRESRMREADEVRQRRREGRPDVPETVPEPQRGINVGQEIRQTDARTIRQIQDLFPDAKLSREQARVLRDLVWGAPEQAARPEAETRTEVREDAIQERETEALPVEERAADRPEVEPKVREQTAEQEAIEETVRSEVEPIVQKNPELMTPEEWMQFAPRLAERLPEKQASFWSGRVRDAIKAEERTKEPALKALHASQAIHPALAMQKPVSSASVDAYGITLPEGYVREGDRYVYKPEVPPPVEPITEQAVEQVPETSEETAPESSPAEPTWPKNAGSLEKPISFWKRFTLPINVPKMPIQTREALVKYAKIENKPGAIASYLTKRVADVEQRAKEPESAPTPEPAVKESLTAEPAPTAEPAAAQTEAKPDVPAAAQAEIPPSVSPAQTTPAPQPAIAEIPKSLRQDAAKPEPQKEKSPFDTKIAKEQKKFLLDEVDKFIETAPESRADVNADADSSALADARARKAGEDIETWVKREKKALQELSEKYGVEADIEPIYEAIKQAQFDQSFTVTIEVPGDGTFEIVNSKFALKDFRSRAEKFPTTEAKSKAPSKPRTEPSKPAALPKKVDDKQLLNILGRFISKDPERLVLNHFWSDGNQSVASDGRRLIIVDKGFGNKSKEGNLYTTAGKPVTEKDLKFPNYQQVIPKKTEIVARQLDAARLFAITKQAEGVLTEKSNSITLHLNQDGSIGMTAKSPDVGDYTHNIQDGAVGMVAFNSEYFTDAINAARMMGQKTFDLSMTEDSSLWPWMFSGPGWKVVLMPMRGETEQSSASSIREIVKKTAKKKAVEQSKPDIQQAANALSESDTAKLAEAAGIPKGSKSKQAKDITEALTDPNQTPPDPPSPTALGILPNPIHLNPTLAGAAKESANAFTSNWLVNMIDRVERGGTPLHLEVATKARSAVNRTKDILGKLSKATEAAKRASGGGLDIETHRAVMQLTRPVNLSSGHRTTLLQQVMDGDVDLNTLTSTQRNIVNTQMKLIEETGKILVNAGFLVTDPNSPTGVRPFTPKKDGRVFLRLTNSDFFELLYAGGDRLKQLAEHIVAHPKNQAAGWTTDQLLERFQSLGEDLRNQTTPESAFRRINAEIPRELPFFPTHWKPPGSRDVLELLHVRPFDIANRVAETTAHRAGFVEFFGQSIAPGDNLVKDIVKQMRQSPGDAAAFVDLSRALNAQPIERMRWFEPGSDSARLARTVDGMLSMAKAHMLGVSTVPNIFEPLGRIQALGTGQDFFRALWAMHGKGKEVYIESLRELGAIAIGDNIMDMTIDPTRPFESIVRIHNEIASRGYLYRLFWRYQHRLAAAVSQEMSNRLQAGKGTDRDVEVLMSAMNISRADAQRMRQGKGTPEEYDAFVRRAGAYTTNQPQLVAEMSRVEQSRLFRTAFAFTSYAMMAGRHFTRNAMTFAKIAEETNWGTRDPAGRREFIGALKNFSRLVLGGTVAGGLTHMTMQFLTGGIDGLKIGAEEAKDEKVRFLRDSFLYFMLAGPYGALIRSMKNDQASLGDKIVSFSFPGMLLFEMNQMWNGTGRYRDASNPLQKSGKLMERFTPIHRVGAAAMAAFGFGGGSQSEQLRTQASVRAFWRWVRDNDPDRLPVGVGREPTPWNVHMRQAYLALRKDEDPEEYVWKALDIEGKSWREAAASLRGRKLIHRYRDNDELTESLRKRIGDDAFDTLESHDEILEAFARSIERRR